MSFIWTCFCHFSEAEWWSSCDGGPAWVWSLHEHCVRRCHWRENKLWEVQYRNGGKFLHIVSMCGVGVAFWYPMGYLGTTSLFVILFHCTALHYCSYYVCCTNLIMVTERKKIQDNVVYQDIILAKLTIELGCSGSLLKHYNVIVWKLQPQWAVSYQYVRASAAAYRMRTRVVDEASSEVRVKPVHDMNWSV